MNEPMAFPALQPPHLPTSLCYGVMACYYCCMPPFSVLLHGCFLFYTFWHFHPFILQHYTCTCIYDPHMTTFCNNTHIMYMQYIDRALNLVPFDIEMAWIMDSTDVWLVTIKPTNKITCESMHTIHKIFLTVIHCVQIHVDACEVHMLQSNIHVLCVHAPATVPIQLILRACCWALWKLTTEFYRRPTSTGKYSRIRHNKAAPLFMHTLLAVQLIQY